MSKLVCDAAVEGNVSRLHQLLEIDPLILRRTTYSSGSTSPCLCLPLHLACRFGHLEFAKLLLEKQPDLTEMIDPQDQSSTPLHLACRTGHLELVTCLVLVNLDVCFARDGQGMNPVHVAASRGHCHVLDFLIRIAPAATRERILMAGPATGPAGSGDTIMHLDELDEETEVELSKANASSHASNETFVENRRNVLLVVASLIATVALQAGINPPGGLWQDDLITNQTSINAAGPIHHHHHMITPLASDQISSSLRRKNSTPLSKHRAGTSILADRNNKAYDRFIIFNTLGLLSAVCCILFMVWFSGSERSLRPLHDMVFIAMVSMTVAYYISLTASSPYGWGAVFTPGMEIVTFGCISGFLLIIFSVCLPHLRRGIRALISIANPNSNT